jgi:hypothetical protein
MSTTAATTTPQAPQQQDDRMRAFYESGLLQDGDDVLVEDSDSDIEGDARVARPRQQRRGPARPQGTSSTAVSVATVPQP